MRCGLLGLTLVVVVGQSQVGEAQLFGERSFGRTRVQSPAARTQGGTKPGVLTGSRRFLRGQRSAADFVGKDLADSAGFVGSTTGRTQGTVASATTGLREEPTARVNQAMTTPPRRGPYPPRIILGPGVGLTVGSQAARQIELTLNPTTENSRRLHVPPARPIRVTVKNRTAILTGVVATEHDRQVAELLTSFEPGVESIENLLRVTDPAPPIPQSRANR